VKLGGGVVSYGFGRAGKDLVSARLAVEAVADEI